MIFPSLVLGEGATMFVASYGNLRKFGVWLIIGSSWVLVAHGCDEAFFVYPV
jgi:hypothetical protein